MCFVRSAEMLDTDWFKQGNNQLVFIGSGSAQVGNKAGEVLGIFKKGARLLVDDSRYSVVYSGFGLHRGVIRTFTVQRLDNIAGWFKFPGEVMKGSFPTIPLLERGEKKSTTSSGDPFLQAGTFVLDENMNLVFKMVETSPGYPKPDNRAIRRALENGEQYGLVTVRRFEKTSTLQSVSKYFIFAVCVYFFINEVRSRVSTYE
jgi:hypothetical protein